MRFTFVYLKDGVTLTASLLANTIEAACNEAREIGASNWLDMTIEREVSANA